MRRSALNSVTQNNLNARSSMGPSAARNPRSSMAFKPADDRRASALPSVGGRRSTNPRPSSMARASTAYNARMGGMRSDPRPLKDKDFMTQSVRTLIAFLTERGYEQPLSPKLLNSPSSKDFQSIFLFLMRRLDPNFSFLKRFEDEIPVILKCLAYPFPLSKSALSAVGSPHTWPPLLGVLSWLVGLNLYDEHRAEREADVALDVHARRDAMFYDNTIAAYQQFLAGEDSHPELDAELRAFFADDDARRETEIAELENDIEQLTSTLDALRTQDSPLALARQQSAAIESNKNKFKLLNATLSEHQQSVKTKVDECDVALRTTQHELAKLAEEKGPLAMVLQHQEEAAIDADRIVADRDKLRDGLARANMERVSAEAGQKDEEQKVAMEMDMLSARLDEYHRLLEGLANVDVPITEQVDLSRCTIRISRDAALTSPEEILGLSVETVVQPPLERLRQTLVSEMPSLNEKSFALQESVDGLEEKLILLRNELSLHQGRSEKLEKEYQEGKTGLTEALQDRSKSILVKEEDMKVGVHKAEQHLRDCERRNVALTEQMRSFSERFTADRQRRVEVLMELENKLRVDRQHIRQCVMYVKAYFDDQAKDDQENDEESR